MKNSNRNIDEAPRLLSKAVKLAKSKSPNNQVVFELLQQASKAGSGEATYAIGTWYLHGKYVDTNLKKAIVFLRRASRAGFPAACFDLALCYEQGVAVEKDLSKAFELYMEAALRGDVDGYSALYRCYWHGVGTTRNRVLANLWEDKRESLVKDIKLKAKLKS
jgi:uncharacterized protein